ncbi:MAG: S-layer family protein, partial [Chlorobiaceae bacterium]|nr:S-layer family protein [Chlorobiaceae bacterium]
GVTQGLGALVLNSTNTTTLGGAVTAASVLTNAGGTTAINGGSVTTSGTQTYNDDVTLGTDTTLTTTDNNVRFFSTVNGTTDYAEDLSVSTGSGNITFSGAIGNLVKLGDILLNTTGTTTLGAVGANSISITGGGPISLGGSVTTIGGQNWGGPLTLATSLTLTSTTSFVNFGSTIDGTTSGVESLTVNADSSTFGGAIGVAPPGTMLNNLTLDVSGAGLALPSITLAGALDIGANGTITQQGGKVLTIGGSTTLSATDGGAPATYYNIILNNSNNDFHTVISNGANITLRDEIGGMDIGATTAHGDLSVTSTNGPITTSGNISTTGDGDIDIVTTGVGNGITLSNTVTANGSGNVTLNADAGTVDINAVVSSTSGDIAVTGDVVTQDANITTGTVGLNVGTVSVTADNGGITMGDLTTTQTADGSIAYSATGNVGLSLLSSTSGTIGVTAGSGVSTLGAITDQTALENANLVTTGQVTLTAETGIGGSGVAADIDTNIDLVQATNQTSGDIYLQELFATNGFTVNGSGVRTLSGNGNVNIDVNAGNLTVDSVVTAHGSGNVTLNADGGTVDLNAVVSSTSGDIVVAGDVVTQDANITTGTVGLDVGTVIVTADNGGITMSDGTVTSTNTGSIGYSATGGVALSQLSSTSGDISVTAGSGASVVGAITDNKTSDEASNLITGGTATLTAETGIGTSVSDMDTTIGTLVATNTTSGDIYVQETSSLIIGGTGVRTLSGNGNINIDVDAGNLTSDSVVTAHGYGNVTLNADLGTVDLNAVVSSTSGDIVVTGDVVTQDANITTGTVGLDVGTVIVTADNGGITMSDGTVTSTNTGTIGYSATGGVALSQLSSTSGDISVTAGSGASVVGAITDNKTSDEASNLITGGTATLTAETGIGTSGSDMDTTIGTLVATNTTSGDIYVQETSGLIIGGTGVRTLSGNGNINIDVDAGNLTVDSVVTAHGYGNVTLNADGGTVDLNAVVSSTSGDIVVTGDVVTQDANITTGTVGSDVGTVIVTADNGGITMSDGTVTSTNTGTIGYSATGGVALSQLSSTSGDISVTAGAAPSVVGAITDNTATEGVNLVTSGHGTLTADTGIGTSAANGDIDVTLGSLTFNSGGLVNISETDGTLVTGSNTADTLILTSGGLLTNTASASIIVSGNSTLWGTSINLGNQSGDWFTTGSLTFNSPGAVSISEDDSTLLVGTSTAQALTLSSLGSITNDGTMNLTVTENSNLTGTSINLGNQSGDWFTTGSLTFNSPGAVSISEDDSTLLVGTSTADSLTLFSVGAITNDGTMHLDVTYNTNLRGSSINLGNQTNDSFNTGTLTFNSRGDVSISEDSGTMVTGINTAANLTLVSAGALANTQYARITVSGNSNLRGTSIDLGNASLSYFNTGSLTFNSAGDVSIRENSDTAVVGSNTAGNLTLVSSGKLASAVSSATIVDGLSSLTGMSINYGNAPGNANLGSGDIFTTARLRFTGSGSVNIGTDSDTQLSGASRASTLTLSSTGALSNAASSNILVTGLSSLSAASINLG